MGNLGDYQNMTELANKFGSPKKLALVVAFCGYAVIRTGEFVLKQGISISNSQSVIKRKNEKALF